MTEFFAAVDKDPRTESSKRIGLWRTWPAARTFPNHKEIQSDRLTLIVLSTGAIEHCYFADDQCRVVCSADICNLHELTGQETTAHGVAHLYHQHGDSFAKLLRGTFSIVVWDEPTQTLKCWIDQFGSGRIVYQHLKGVLSISSNIQLLELLSGNTPEIDPAAIVEYLQYACIPAPRTIYKGIRKLDGGHQLISAPTPDAHSYWRVAFGVDPEDSADEKMWADRTYEAIRRAIGVCTESRDQKVLGCFLSGGTDSSTVAGMLGSLTGTSSRSFSIGFEDPRYNEIEYARVAARHFSCKHSEYFVKPEDILNLIAKAAEAYDEPFGNSSIIPTYHCARLAVESGVTHLLAGDGGDELFGGNERYTSDRVFERYDFVPTWLKQRVVEPTVSFMNSCSNGRLSLKAARYIRRASVPLPDRIFSYSFLSTVDRRELMSRQFLDSSDGCDPLEIARTHYRSAATTDPLNRWLYLDQKIIIGDNDLRKVTRMGHLAGITIRYPFLNPDLANFAGSIPPSLKVKGKQLRYLFKRAMSRLLPSEVIHKTKHGFGLPYSVWLGEFKPLKEFTFDILGSSECRQRGYFRPDLLEWLWVRYESLHKQFYGEVLWVFLMLEMWHKAHAPTSIAIQSNEALTAS